MKFVLIFGPAAVGKMTVGHELQRLTGLRLFHNHMTIDLALRFFEFGTPAFERLVGEFRRRIFEEVASSDLPGLVFTYVWALDVPGDKAYIDDLVQIFEAQGAQICFVELEANQEERLRRNETEFRLREKPSKRDIERSDRNLWDIDQKYRLNSTGDFFYPEPERYLKIDNTRLAPDEVARRIVAAFALSLVDSTIA